MPETLKTKIFFSKSTWTKYRRMSKIRNKITAIINLLIYFRGVFVRDVDVRKKHGMDTELSIPKDGKPVVVNGAGIKLGKATISV